MTSELAQGALAQRSQVVLIYLHPGRPWLKTLIDNPLHYCSVFEQNWTIVNVNVNLALSVCY